eukprot:scaffold321_cov95-Cylindrotheca_fusiformis.AAC.10
MTVVRKRITAYVCGSVAALICYSGFSSHFILGRFGGTTTTTSCFVSTTTTTTINTTADHKPPLVTVVTGFSENHLSEGIGMLQTLIDVKYSGPLYIYLMHGPSQALSSAIKVNFTQLIKASPLQATIVEMEVEEYQSYCFKPRIIQDFLTLAANTEPSSTPHVLFWSDTSTPFAYNPEIAAKRMVQDQVDFAGTTGYMGMGENTDQKTFDYLNMTKANFIHRRSLQASAFMVNLDRVQGTGLILTPYINCGLRECHTCMAPVGTNKTIPEGKKFLGPPSSEYIVHRQDQSVLSLLAYQCQDQKACKISINERYYFPRERRRVGEHIAREIKFSY